MIAPTTNSEPTSCRLAVTQTGDDRDAALEILQNTLGMNAIDAKTRLGHVPAVWPEEFTEETAREAVQRLQALGSVAAAVSATDVPDLRKGRTLHHVQCRDDGFAIISITGKPEQTIAWENVALLSIADVAGLRQGLATAIPDGVFRHAPGIAETHVGEHGLEMWLITASPLSGYRIDAELMNYEYLGARRSPSTAANIAQLVADIRRHASNLTLTPSAEAYVREPAGTLHQIPSPAAHRDLVAAHWVVERCRQARRQGAHQASSHPPTDFSKSPMSDDRLIQTHHRLQREIEALRACCHDLEGDPSVRSALIQRIEKLRTTIDEHFALEEDSGYLRTALDVAPRYSRLAELLQQQHEELRNQLRRLTAESDDLCVGVQNFIEELEVHEHAENALVQAAFSDDLAAGD